MFNIKEMDVQELKSLLEDSSEEFKLIDVRTPAEFANGIIAGGECIPLHLIPLKVNDFKGDEKVVIYCRTGARSGQACAFLEQNGIHNAINVRGGIVAWAQMGFTITQP